MSFGHATFSHPKRPPKSREALDQTDGAINAYQKYYRSSASAVKFFVDHKFNGVEGVALGVQDFDFPVAFHVGLDRLVGTGAVGGAFDGQIDGLDFFAFVVVDVLDAAFGSFGQLDLGVDPNFVDVQGKSFADVEGLAVLDGFAGDGFHQLDLEIGGFFKGRGSFGRLHGFQDGLFEVHDRGGDPGSLGFGEAGVGVATTAESEADSSAEEEGGECIAEGGRAFHSGDVVCFCLGYPTIYAGSPLGLCKFGPVTCGFGQSVGTGKYLGGTVADLEGFGLLCGMNRERALASSPEFYKRYISLVPDGNLIQLLEDQLGSLHRYFLELAPEKWDYRYAEGKWSVKEVLGHLTDSERIFGYRALRIVRKDATDLAGFDENDYVTAANFDSREGPDLLEEFDLVRRSHIVMLRSHPAEDFERLGTANELLTSVGAIGWTMLGHAAHHLRVLGERYA